MNPSIWFSSGSLTTPVAVRIWHDHEKLSDPRAPRERTRESASKGGEGGGSVRKDAIPRPTAGCGMGCLGGWASRDDCRAARGRG